MKRTIYFLGALLFCLMIFRGSALFALDTWEIKDHRGAPCLFCNGKAITPLWFWQWEPMEADIKAMAGQKIDLFSFFGSIGHYENPYWREDGSFNMDYQDKHIRNLLDWAPSARFFPRIFANAPNWWEIAHPEEQIQFHNGIKANTWGTKKDSAKFNRESFASQKALAENGVYFRKAIRHLIDTYDSHLMGIHVTHGPSGENFSWDAYLTHHPKMFPTSAGDLSEPMRQAFIKYLKKKYKGDLALLRKAFADPDLTFDSVQIPNRAKRLELVDGAWRDPARSRLVPDYFECQNEITVDMLDFYCKIVKQESNNKLPTLVFYGYTQDENWPLECDQRAVSKIYQRSSVDMFSAPHTYYRRGLGEDGLVRQYFSSAALHGKLFVDEGDDQTHLEMLKPRPDHRCHARNLDQSKAFLYREFGNMVTQGTGLWYMDLGKGWFRDRDLIDCVGRMKKWADVSMNHSRKRCSEVALISAPESEYYLGYRRTPANEISYGLYHDQLGDFFRTGAPFDWYLIDDLDAVKKGNYKVCVFLDCFFLSDQQRKQIADLKADKRTLVWFYAPGYAAEHDLSLKRMEDLAGFHFQKNPVGVLQSTLNDGKIFGVPKTQNAVFTVLPEKGVRKRTEGIGDLKGKITAAERKFDNWTSFFCAVPALPREELIRIYKNAGVHLYAESDDVVSASESWLMIHTRSAGIKKFQLREKYRKITEITEEKFTAKNTDHFEIDLPQYSTSVFLMEK
ncbi:MAG: hypothetical protein Q4G69_05695 [Planctomycetia bacterium]|nr:hypothetical protein [Planctomycetia bacterium]